ncbi:MAG: hypothetical protein GJ680_01440 [Alteromonadaceae bacterium]|nr:hypothetical protein [Alteromonadaceae bacterium]
MSDREAIHQYLKSLNKYLARLDANDAQEVEREIESHIYDVIDQHESMGKAVQIEEVLAGFGSPRELAQAYVSHITIGSPPPEGFSAIRSIQEGASKGLYWITAFLGYLVGAVMLVLSIVKLWAPEQVGLWSTAGGNSFVVGMVEQSQQQGGELLGFWFTPIFLVAGAGLLWLTFSILKVFKQTRLR